MISSRSVCRTDHQKSEHFRKIGASGSPEMLSYGLLSHRAGARRTRQVFCYDNEFHANNNYQQEASVHMGLLVA